MAAGNNISTHSRTVLPSRSLTAIQIKTINSMLLEATEVYGETF